VRVGFALHFATGGSLARSRALWWASLERRMLPLEDLDHFLVDRGDHDSVAAAQAEDFVRFLLEEERQAAFAPFLLASRDQPLSDALAATYQENGVALENAWREDVAKHRAFLPILAGGTLLWVVLAAGVQIQKCLRTRKEAPARER